MKAMTAFKFLCIYEKKASRIFLSLFLMLSSAFLNATTINVTNYVTGDGVTDDSAGLQQAFDAAATQNATLQIPANCIIRTTKNLFIHGTCNIQGSGDSSIILCDDDLAKDHGYYWICVGLTGHRNDGGIWDTFSGTISNLCIKASSNAKFGRAFFIFNTSATTISDIFFDFRDGVSSPETQWYLFSATASGNNANWELWGSGPPKTIENITITRNTIIANHCYTDYEGFGMELANNVVISNNFIYGVGDDPIGCHFINGLEIKNNYCYSIDGRILANNCTDVLIEDN